MGGGHGAREPGELAGLPAVHELAAELGPPHAVAVAVARRAIAERRAELHGGHTPEVPLVERARTLLAEARSPSLRRVLNATGVVLHTNLGRAPLASAAAERIAEVARTRYLNLELELAGGDRGTRQAHVAPLLCELTGAEAALIVNNGAGAVLLAVAALAGAGRGVAVSRGELVEIGGGFRIPEVVAGSGAVLVEVGTTNRTRTADFADAIAARRTDRPDRPAIAAILRVHPSNFRVVGFTAAAPLAELCALGTPVIDDIGSGLLDPGLVPAGFAEPSIRGSLIAGAAVVCCSADKLLGGPQAGLLLGRREAIAAAERHPLARALRVDALTLAGLAATVELLTDPVQARRTVPVLAMLHAPEAELRARACRMQSLAGPAGEVIESASRAGGGSLPLLELPGPVLALDTPDPEALAAALRAGEPPVIGRVHAGRLLLDPRTLTDGEAGEAAAALARALART